MSRALSPRQLAVVHAILATGSADGAALLLGISPSTVHTHLAAARRRLGVDTTPQLVWLLTRGGELAALEEITTTAPQAHVTTITR